MIINKTKINLLLCLLLLLTIPIGTIVLNPLDTVYASSEDVVTKLDLAKKLGKRKTVVTVLLSTAERYFSTDLFKE